MKNHQKRRVYQYRNRGIYEELQHNNNLNVYIHNDTIATNNNGDDHKIIHLYTIHPKTITFDILYIYLHMHIEYEWLYQEQQSPNILR